MGKTIYYFSGTGNSLVVARGISENINAKLISIPSVINDSSLRITADIMGIVFPVYHQGVPLIIKKFVDKIHNLKDKYIFAVCTYGDSLGISLKYLDRNVKTNGGNLDAGFAVRMPYNYINPAFTLSNFFSSFKLREISQEKKQEMFNKWKEELKIISGYIQAQKRGKIEVKAEIIEKLVDFLNLRNSLQKYVWLKASGYEGNFNITFEESINLMDYGFNVTNHCNGCGVCSNICPIDNINIENNSPVWLHQCEQCFACLQWCPKESIQFRNGTLENKRYHHPEVNLSEMLSNDN